MNPSNPYDGLIERLGQLALLADSEMDAEAFTDAKTALSRLTRDVAELQTRIIATHGVIESGYRGIDKADKCAHDRYGFEDCIACYDEALMNALNGDATLTRLSRTDLGDGNGS